MAYSCLFWGNYVRTVCESHPLVGWNEREREREREEGIDMIQLNMLDTKP